MYVDPYGILAFFIFFGAGCIFVGVGHGWNSRKHKNHQIFAETMAFLKGGESEFRLTHAEFDVLTERARQIEEEGYTSDHDDKHEIGELADAAACYARNAGACGWAGGWPGEGWPWAHECWKPSTPRHDLVKAGALILAEIDRLDRAAMDSGKKGVSNEQ